MIEVVGPYVVSILTGFGGWYFGKRKTNAEAQILEIKGLDAITAFYETALNNTNVQLNKYITITESNQIKITDLEEIVDILLHTLRADGCDVKNCPNRIVITTNLQKYIKKEKHEKASKINSEKI